MVEREGGGHTRLKDKVPEDQGEKIGLHWPCYRDGAGNTKSGHLRELLRVSRPCPSHPTPGPRRETGFKSDTHSETSKVLVS